MKRTRGKERQFDQISLKKLIEALESLSNHHAFPLDKMVDIFKENMAETVRRNYEEKNPGKLISIEMQFDESADKILSFRSWEVIPDELAKVVDKAEEPEDEPDKNLNGDEDEDEDEFHYNPDIHTGITAAKKQGKDLEVGQKILKPYTVGSLGRIASTTLKHLVAREIRERDREKVQSDYQDKTGQLVSGIVENRTRIGYEIKLKDNVRAILPFENIIGDERFRTDENVRAVLIRLDVDARGRQPMLVLSRRHEMMLLELFKLEVPEVAEHVIEIKAVSRSAGIRSKIAVKTNDGRIDPVGVCVGMRGARVQAVMEQIYDERVDVILWSDDLRRLACNALAPAKVERVFVDEEKHAIEVAVNDSSRALALGKNGENVRLASKLIGWPLNIVGLDEIQKRRVEDHKRQQEQMLENMMEQLEISREMAAALVLIGVTELDAIVAIDSEALHAKMPDFDIGAVNDLIDRASMLAIMRDLEIPGEEGADNEQEEALKTLPGMDNVLAALLAAAGILTVLDLADADADLLKESLAVNIEQAKIDSVVLEARKHMEPDAGKA